jgi:3-hydroxyisobutyrate dehydrogenase-like beta-hydroxyacid dehydrogenase
MVIAVIGLGIMGSRLARRLLDAGFEVRGFDISGEALAALEEMGGVTASSPAEAVAGCEIALLSLLTSDIAREVCLGSSGIASSSQRPLLVLDATTGRPEDSIATAEGLAVQGIDYADMTVSGNAAVAEQGGLVIMLGGSEHAYRQAIPVMESLGRSHHHVGSVGSGARMKLIVNHVLAVNRASLAEGLVVAEMAGLDLESTLAVLRDSAAYSKAMDLWGDRMVAGDHEHPNARLRQSHKDSKLILEQALSLGSPADHIQLVESTLDQGETRGLADKDNSSAIEVIRRRAGIGRVPEE